MSFTSCLWQVLNMTAIRQEVLNYIDNIPDSKLEALKPILVVLVNDTLTVETDLTEEEKEIIANGRKEYQNGTFVNFNDVM